MDAYVVVVLGALILSTTFYACAGKDPHATAHPDALPEYYCSDAPCLNGGRCIPHNPISRDHAGYVPHPYDKPHVDHFTCECTGHWTGTYCEIAGGHPDALPEFHCSDSPCFNGGTCHSHDPIRHEQPAHGAPHPYDKPHIDHFICQCTGHWTGVHCEIALPEFHCSDTSCLNGGRCLPHGPIRHEPEHGALHPYAKPHVDYFTCQCTSHWTGVHCETGLQNFQTSPNLGNHTDTHVGRCALNPCIIDGTCALPGHQPDHMYTCQCQNDHTALECNTATGICLHYDCHNGGHCTSDNGRVYCQGCHHPWHGDDCGTADQCNLLSCMHTDYCIVNGHDARCHCRSGWTGFDCSTDVDECSLSNPCLHGGNCTNTPGHYTCKCDGGWTGAQCQTDVNECSHQNPCRNGGTCKNTPGHYTCICDGGYTGELCQTALHIVPTNAPHGGYTTAPHIVPTNAPHGGYTTVLHVGRCAANPCVIANICTQHENNYTCQCVNETTSRECNAVTGYCSYYHCYNGGHCTSDNGSVICQGCHDPWHGGDCGTANSCDQLDCIHGHCQSLYSYAPHARCICSGSGYTGLRCDIDIDECTVNTTCQNGGICVNSPGHFNCHCAKGWTDTHCQTDVDECSHTNLCQHGGTCTNTPGHYTCTCDQGWTGARCHYDIDECSATTICQNGGHCVNLPGHFNCHCANGWTDTYCQTDINECSVYTTCLNGGTCVNLPGHFNCHCANGWTDIQCQTDVDECAHINPCLHGGNCTNTPGHYTCRCDAGWIGDHCQTDVDECSLSNPCQNGGNCTNTPGHYTCICDKGWTGEHCQTDVDECAHNNPCLHGGHCTNTPGHYMCKCDGGWTGDHCQTDVDECSPNNPCQNGGNCTNTPGNYTCRCDARWTGDYCQTDMFPKCNHTCFLDAVFLSTPVVKGTTDCSGTSTHASNEALPQVCCSMRAHADWQHGEQVQTNGACIDGKIPPSTPIAAVNGTHLINAGIFYSCIKNGFPGFTMLRQDCTTLPQVMHVDSTSDPTPDNYYVIY